MAPKKRKSLLGGKKRTGGGAAARTESPPASSEAVGLDAPPPPEPAPSVPAMEAPAPQPNAGPDEAPAKAEDVSRVDHPMDAPRRRPSLSPEEPVEAPKTAYDMAGASKDDAEDDYLSKDVSTANPAQGREVFPKEFEEEEGDDWFVRTGQPAPERDTTPLEPSELVNPPDAPPWPMVLGMLAAAAVILVVGLIVVSLIT